MQLPSLWEFIDSLSHQFDSTQERECWCRNIGYQSIQDFENAMEHNLKIDYAVLQRIINYTSLSNVDCDYLFFLYLTHDQNHF